MPALMLPTNDPWALFFRNRLAVMGLTPAWFAKQYQCSRANVYHMMSENGTLPRDSRIEMLALLLGVPVSDVLRARGAAWAYRGKVTNSPGTARLGMPHGRKHRRRA
jgi:hypothetical protein